ncbi:copper-binding protein [Glaciimonas immobilis]|uniref:Cu(I)/Ag(I) efflux system protein CusF n=1 Tax=Glaciimonas immobilis TaxID=728004 RepID=A0A840S1F4_9BURK|nr:copper-binding protein [Glaciimonas immobilis]KAF3995981.1 copper-binding protein [Glaciimonas immobilis]MBB5202450.1 Cu(I)/Ag(I) efflux system protein CusF [Glaciimonas immobilis]
MKPIVILTLIVALSASTHAMAQSSDTKNMDMKGMNMHNMPMDKMSSDSSTKTTTHKATGTVKAVDIKNGKLTLVHGPVKSLNWPAMTMTFSVKDKLLLDKLSVDKKVTIDFVKQDMNYVVTAVN